MSDEMKRQCPRCHFAGGTADDGYHVLCKTLNELEQERTVKSDLLAVLTKIAEGCGHQRCHATRWVIAAQRAVATYGQSDEGEATTP